MSVDNTYNGSMLNMIDNIVEVVVNSYFYWADATLREDLMQEGYLKAYELLRAGNYDPNQSLRNYLFTGIRNAMTNLSYHNNKEKHSSYDLYNDNVDVEMGVTTNTTLYEISIEQIKKSCNKYNSNYVDNVVDYINSLGFTLEYTGNRVEKSSDIIMKAIIVDIMWNL